MGMFLVFLFHFSSRIQEKKQAHEVIMFSVPTSACVPADQFSLKFEQFAAGGHTNINMAHMGTYKEGASGTQRMVGPRNVCGNRRW